MNLLPIGLLLALAPGAHAFAPGGQPTYEGGEPQRIHVIRPAVQARLDRTPAWQDFLAAEGPDWDVVWDEATGTPRRIRGPGHPVRTDSPDAVAEAVLRWLAPYDHLLGFEPGQIVVRRVSHVERLDSWYVDLDVLRDGLTTWRGGITARIKAGRLVDLGVSTYGTQPVVGAFVLDDQAALREAITRGPAPGAQHERPSVERRLLPRETLSGIELRRVWEVRTRTGDPPGLWVSFVDAETGELLSVHNEVRFLDGHVTAEHDVRSPLDGLTISPLPLVEVENDDGDVVVTDAQGAFTVADVPPLVTDLRGRWARVTNDAGPEGLLVGNGPDLLWTAADATQAEIDTYVFLHQVRDWGQQWGPEVRMVKYAVDAYVNLNQTCNAFFDGDVNFFRAGNGCNNTGRIADVVFHEWGHGFHYWSIVGGFQGFDGSLSEGASDTVAFLQTGDHRMAPGFYTNGGAIRNVDNTRRYPEDFVPADAFVHSNGLIFAGAMWDLNERLAEELGEQAAHDVTSSILAGLLKGGPDIASAYDEALFADDDNGNLADGTPHECALLEAFGAHGLGPLGAGQPYVAVHEPPTSFGGDLPLRWDIQSASPRCFAYEPTDGALHYRVDGGEWQVVDITFDGAGVRAVVPSPPLGSLLEYWLEIEHVSGSIFNDPTGGPIHPYTLYVGSVLEVWCQDFEADDGGFKHRLLSGTDEEGADDWQWGAPAGRGGDPASAHSGDRVWGTDLGQGNFNGTYQSQKHTRLRSPPLDLKHYDGAFLHYWRWLTVEDGHFDKARILADDAVAWTNHATNADIGDEHHIDDQWMPHAVPLPAEATGDRQVRLEWQIQSDQGLTMGGWNLDDVCIFAPDTPDNRLGIHDFDARSAGGATLLGWTQPVHEPLREVKLVRSFDGWPTGPDDGDVLYHDTAPVPGESVVVGDPVGAGYYAVYASDGERWLSWTRPGLNADRHGGTSSDGTTPDGTDPDRSSSGGCACDVGTTGPAGGAWLLLGLLAWRSRRRDGN